MCIASCKHFCHTNWSVARLTARLARKEVLKNKTKGKGTSGNKVCSIFIGKLFNKRLLSCLSFSLIDLGNNSFRNGTSFTVCAGLAKNRNSVMQMQLLCRPVDDSTCIRSSLDYKLLTTQVVNVLAIECRLVQCEMLDEKCAQHWQQTSGFLSRNVPRQTGETKEETKRKGNCLR